MMRNAIGLVMGQVVNAAPICPRQITQRVQRPRVVDQLRHALKPFRFPQQALDVLDHNPAPSAPPTQRKPQGSERSGDTEV
jgi:hypothetical protein